MLQLGIRPKVKSVGVVHVLANMVYVEGIGQVTEIADPDGAVAALFGLCDGQRSAQEIISSVVLRFPNWGADDVHAALSQLSEAGFLENAALGPEGLLDQYSQRRWNRNLSFFEAYASMTRSKYELQHQIADARVALLGVGGLGTHLLLDLAAVGVLHVRIVDFDRVELSNLNRQIAYAEADIGRLKVEAAAERAQAFSPRMTVEPIHRRISGARDVQNLVDGFDLVLSVVDRPTMDIVRWVNGGVVAARVPTIFGGVDTTRGIQYTVLPGRSGCVECWRCNASNNNPDDAALLALRQESAYEGNDAAFGPLVTMVTGMMMTEAVRMVTGICPPLGTGRLQEFSFDTGQLRTAETWTLIQSCPVCGQVQADMRRDGIECVGAVD